MTNSIIGRCRAFTLTVAVTVIYSLLVSAYPGKRLRLDQLVDASDVIAVVDLTNIRSVGTVEERVDGNSFVSESRKVDARVLRKLKGSCPEHLTVSFTTPTVFVGYPGIGSGVQMTFLKCQQGSCVFADQHFPTLPATASFADAQGGGPLTTSLDRVAAELGAVISSKSAPPSDKWKILIKAYGIPKLASFTSALKLGLQNANDNDLKSRIEAELISRDDLSQLSVVKDSLLAGQTSQEQKELFLSVIANSVNDPDAGPVLAHLLHSEDAPTRRAAAEGIWHTASQDAIPDLLKALQDEDEQVRFYAVRGLADINAQPRWGPSSEEFRENQQQYLVHWQDWGAAHH